MAFDPSVISQIPEGASVDVAQDRAKALTLADLYDQNTLNKGKVAEQKQGQADMTYAKQILSGKDLSKLEDQDAAVAQITKRSPKLGMDLMKSFQSGQAGKTDNDRSQLELYNSKNDIIGGAVYQLKAKHDQLISQGMNEQQVHDAMKGDLMTTLGSVTQAKLPNGQPLLNDQDRQFLQQGFANGYNPQVVDSLVSRSTQAKAAIAQKFKEMDEQRKDKDEDRKERATNASIAQGSARTAAAQEGALEPEDSKALAEQYLAGDKSVLTGLGRGAQGAKNIIAVRRAIRTTAEERGMKPADIAAKLAEYNGFQAEQRSLGTRLANIETASQEAYNMIDVAKKASDDVPRGTFLPWNKLVKGDNVITNDPAYAKFAAATQAVVNTWARAISPTGQPTVADKDHADKLLNTAQSKEAYDAVLDQFRTEIGASLNAPEEVKKQLHDRFVGKSSAPASAPSSAPGAQPAASSPASGKAPGGGDHPPPPPGFVVQN